MQNKHKTNRWRDIVPNLPHNGYQECKHFTLFEVLEQEDFFKGVPSRDKMIPLSEEEKFCPDCDAGMETVGKEFVHREFRFTPAKGEIVNIYRETAKCPVCSWQPAMKKAVWFVKARFFHVAFPHRGRRVGAHHPLQIYGDPGKIQCGGSPERFCRLFGDGLLPGLSSSAGCPALLLLSPSEVVPHGSHSKGKRAGLQQSGHLGSSIL